MLLRYTLRFSIFFLILFFLDFCISYFLFNGLKKYYGLNIPSKILLIGHSHTMLGLDKKMMEDSLHYKVAKYALEGANVVDRLTMIKHFLHQNGDSVKLIIYDIDAFFITGKGLSINSYKRFYPFMDDPYINEYLKVESKSDFEYLFKKWIRTSRFSDLNVYGSLRGYLGFYSNIKYGAIDTAAYKKKIENNEFVKISFDKDLQSKFEDILNLTFNKKIKLVLIYIPTIGMLNRAEPEKFKQAMNLIQVYETKYPNVYFLDYNKDLQNNYDLFDDPVHLNFKGNKIVTVRLINDLKKIFN